MSIASFSSPPSDLRKVLVLIRGSRGDNEPFWPVCARLLELGIELTVITPMQAADFFQEVENATALLNKHQPKRLIIQPPAVAAANGTDASSTAPPYTSHPTFGSRFRLWTVTGEVDCAMKDLAWVRAGSENDCTIKRFYEVVDKPALFECLHKMAAIVGYALPDVIVEDLFHYGQIMAQIYCIPSIVLAPAPAHYTTDQMPPIHFRITPYPFKFLNRWSHFFFKYVYLGSSMVDNQLKQRQEFKLPLALWSYDAAEYHYLIAVSPTLFPQPEDAPKRLHFVGGRCNIQDADFFPSGWQPADDLLKFLQLDDALAINGKKGKKEPVIYIGLGSMPLEMTEASAAELGTDLLKVANELGVRLLLSGTAMKPLWNALLKQHGSANSVQLRDRVRFEATAPHGWLFKRVSGVIHHGGVGTTMTALGSGTPQSIFAIGFDQPFWAYRLHQLTAEDPSTPFKATWAVKAAASDYRAAIAHLLSPAVREKFSVLGRSVCDEPCASDAVITELFNFFESRRFITARRLGIIPKWKNAEEVKSCEISGVPFGCTKWKYQCYACGKYICSAERSEKIKHISTFGPSCHPCKQCEKVWEQAERKAAKDTGKAE